MNPTGIEITDSNFGEYACGQCCSIMMGDEDICPVCGTFNNFTNPVKMSAAELKDLVEGMHAQENRELLGRLNGKDFT